MSQKTNSWFFLNTLLVSTKRQHMIMLIQIVEFIRTNMLILAITRKKEANNNMQLQLSIGLLSAVKLVEW